MAGVLVAQAGEGSLYAAQSVQNENHEVMAGSVPETEEAVSKATEGAEKEEWKETQSIEAEKVGWKEAQSAEAAEGAEKIGWKEAQSAQAVEAEKAEKQEAMAVAFLEAEKAEKKEAMAAAIEKREKAAEADDSFEDDWERTEHLPFRITMEPRQMSRCRIRLPAKK